MRVISILVVGQKVAAILRCQRLRICKQALISPVRLKQFDIVSVGRECLAQAEPWRSGWLTCGPNQTVIWNFKHGRPWQAAAALRL